jgi:hypothetical protein
MIHFPLSCPIVFLGSGRSWTPRLPPPDAHSELFPHPPISRLESLLTASTARAHVLVSSVQLLPTHRELLSEGWPRFPAARRRLLRLLLDARVRAPVVVSGDVHFAELMAARRAAAAVPLSPPRLPLPPPISTSPLGPHPVRLNYSPRR